MLRAMQFSMGLSHAFPRWEALCRQAQSDTEADEADSMSRVARSQSRISVWSPSGRASSRTSDRPIWVSAPKTDRAKRSSPCM